MIINTTTNYGLTKLIKPCIHRVLPNKVSKTSQLIERLRKEIDAARSQCSYSTHKNRITAVNFFELYIKDAKLGRITLKHLTPELIKALERWALDKGYKPGYVALHMRCLRSLINRINGRGNELFRNIHTANCQTEKRAVSEDTIKQIRQLQLPANSNLALARDIFLFCFCGMGIPLIDAVMLKKSQLHDGHLIYNRRKTNRMVKIPICHELQQVIERLSSKNSPCLLPVITGNGTDKMRQYKSFYQRYMRSLAKIEKMINSDCHLTSYTPRHSWASIAYKQGISINEIAQALGHSNANITYHYVMELSSLQLAIANNKVLMAVQ